MGLRLFENRAKVNRAPFYCSRQFLAPYSSLAAILHADENLHESVGGLSQPMDCELPQSVSTCAVLYWNCARGNGHRDIERCSSGRRPQQPRIRIDAPG